MSAAQSLFQQFGHDFIEPGIAFGSERLDLLDQVSIEFDCEGNQALGLVELALFTAVQGHCRVLAKTARCDSLIHPIGDGDAFEFFKIGSFHGKTFLIA